MKQVNTRQKSIGATLVVPMFPMTTSNTLARSGGGELNDEEK